MIQFETMVKKQEEIESLKKELSNYKKLVNETLDELYILEDKFDYDETEQGKKIGLLINKLQETL